MSRPTMSACIVARHHGDRRVRVAPNRPVFMASSPVASPALIGLRALAAECENPHLALPKTDPSVVRRLTRTIEPQGSHHKGVAGCRGNACGRRTAGATMARQGPDGPPRVKAAMGAALSRGHRRRGGTGGRSDAQRGGSRVHPRAGPPGGGALERRRTARHRAEPNPQPAAAVGLRTVDGRFNNLIPGQEEYGAADRDLPEAAARSAPGEHRRPRRPATRTVPSGTTHADERLRLRLRAAHDLAT